MLIAAAVVTLGVFAVDTPPFTPTAQSPDYTAAMVEKTRNLDDTKLMVTHHGPWTRTERLQRTTRAVDYFCARSGARLTINGNDSIVIKRHVEARSDIDFDAHDTGEKQSPLGESCTVWDVWRTRRPLYGAIVSHLACVTDDGITLWEKTMHGEDVLAEIEASRLERRPVSDAEVQFPRALLTLDWWDTSLPSLDAQSTPDHEVVMQLSNGAASDTASTLTKRRLGPWQYQERTTGLHRWISITHDSRRAQFQYRSDQSGAPAQLNMTRPDSDSIRPEHRAPEPKASLSRSETVLGETCQWFDMMPHVFDAGQTACLTRDGIVLKQVDSGRPAKSQEWTAIRMVRRPIQLDEIKPPTDLLDPRTWGLD